MIYRGDMWFWGQQGTSCDDGDSCTDNDVCKNGKCKGKKVICPGGECFTATCEEGKCIEIPKADVRVNLRFATH